MERVVVELPINNGFSLAGTATAPRKRQVRFSARHDIILLREVIAQNPFASKEPGRIWARVGEIITAALQDENFEVDARRCRERTMLLLDYYKKQDFPSLRRFGTERLYAQKEDLLHEVLELEAEKGLLAGGENTKYQDDELRKRALEELTLPEQDKPNITITQTHTTGKNSFGHQDRTGQDPSQNQKRTARRWQSSQQRPQPSSPASAAARPTLRSSASWRNAQKPSSGYERRSFPCAGRSWRFKGVKSVWRGSVLELREKRENGDLSWRARSGRSSWTC
ncbi:uncharacterized protein [Pseudochaenichthys georgianus]|uniref:uncharacterized protein isoform X1 n=1 Tax=Pseudochaenichthys georgianus TaxID=52239 RepID=UPI00146A7BBD|nr:uncharacterized protein si:dkey-45d16.4 isoform X1 [Pseudochaenichthys georgianus]